MKYAISIAATSAAIALAATAHAGVNLVQNGQFAAPSLPNSALIGDFYQYGGAVTDWDTDGYNFLFLPGTADTTGADQGGGIGDPLNLWGPGAGGGGINNGLTATSPGGGNFIAADGDYEVGALTQTINNLTVGKNYTLRFNYAFAQQAGWDGPTQQNWTASLGNQSFTTATYNLPDKGFSGWNPASYTFTATSSSEVLSFLAWGNIQLPPFALLGDVSLEASGVPEPAAWALMLMGVGGLGAAARLRRRGLAAAA